MEEQYGMGDLRQYMNGRSIFPPIPPPPDLLSGHRTLTPAHHYEMVMGVGMVNPGGAGGGLHHHHHHHHHQLELIRSDSNTNSTTTASAATTASTIPCGGGSGLCGGGAIGTIGFMSSSSCGIEMEGVGLGMGDGGNGRWPRQETLTLLEIRSRLDPKFKEANQKGPLWDEVSRIMSEEHGYQRSGKKCREKFENLYKYYKKTKEGKAGRQDGKHYRFFRQLEALYGETSNASASASENHHLPGHNNNNVPYNNNNASVSINIQEPFFQGGQKLSDHSLTLSNSSDFDTTSSEDSDLNLTAGDNDSVEKMIITRKKRKGKRSWKAKIRDFIDAQMRKLMDKQEAWLEKIMKTIEMKEQERVAREEEWRKQEVGRVEREHKFWANERSWIESRDAAMMEALRTLAGNKEVLMKALPIEHQEHIVARDQLQTSMMSNKNQNDNGSHETINSIIKGDGWPECEVTRLIQLRTSTEPRFHDHQIQIGCPEDILWEEIAAKMGCLGYDRTPLMCKEKWDSISSYLIKCSSKKRKENSRFGCYLTNNESVTSQGGTYSCETNDHQTAARQAQNDQGGASPPNHDGSYRFVMDAENLWDNYGVKFSKGNN